MRTDIQLTPHFKLSEFERSATAEKYGIDNHVPSEYIPTLQQLCKTILEPLRAYINSITPHKQGEQEGVFISSGYRCNQLNIKVGGVYASQHTVGEAADIHIPLNDYSDWDDNQCHTNMNIAKSWFNWLEHHTNFDQLILETANGKDYWIHVSCRKNIKANRHQVFRKMKK